MTLPGTLKAFFAVALGSMTKGGSIAALGCAGAALLSLSWLGVSGGFVALRLRYGCFFSICLELVKKHPITRAGARINFLFNVTGGARIISAQVGVARASGSPPLSLWRMALACAFLLRLEWAFPLLRVCQSARVFPLAPLALAVVHLVCSGAFRSAPDLGAVVLRSALQSTH